MGQAVNFAIGKDFFFRTLMSKEGKFPCSSAILISYHNVNCVRVKHRMWSYESKSAHILLFKILSLISRIKKKLCIHHECGLSLSNGP